MNFERADTPKVNEDMDCICLQTALDRLLGETMAELKQIKPDILIEFRQRYIGPFIRRYGNMLRVCDCPESGLANRVGSIDLRLMNRYTAVHSDPIVWNERDTGDSGSSDHRYAFFNDAVFGENGIPDSRTPQYGGELHGSDEEISKTASNGPD